MYIKWGLLQLKRNIKSFSFWCVMVILVLTYYICGYVEQEHSKNLDVLLCSEDSEIGDRVIDYLTEDDMEGYVYHIMDDRDDIYTSIARGEATCGFVFTEEFDKAVKRMDPDGEVLLYQAVNTFDGYTLREIIYPAILNCSSDVLFADYLNSISDEKEAKEAVLDNFRSIIGTRSLKIYDTINLEADENISEKRSNVKLSFFIMMLLLLAATFITVLEGFKVNRAVFRALKKGQVCTMCIESALINFVLLLIPVIIISFII